MGHIKGFQPLHDIVGGLPDHDGSDLVTDRIPGIPGMHDDIRDAQFAVEDVQDRLSQIGRSYDA
ncbi:hypothetical protein [Mycolicibacterium sp. CBMA 295]|uniref:hypothetical protein n=1 Tax=Mycolicibacterium sp. CBMA 295 TaxID=2606605 RepID=UPI001EE4A4F4|nr:hypothetical protein [Mycolicibacterium sp. CBMA 295]